MTLKRVLALASVIQFVVAASFAQAATSFPPAAFLAGYLHLPDGAGFKLADVDLHGDGQRETLIYVANPDFCGSGGCNLYVLAPRARTYRIMMRATIVQLPIRVLRSSHHGWRDIGVTVFGGGIIHPYEAVLRFDGRRYPQNPTVPPAVPVREAAGEIVIGR
jgi:hypothetical protein